MYTSRTLEIASEQLLRLPGHVFDVISITKPVSTAAAMNLIGILSKLSPILGNLIEFNLVELLNEHHEFQGLGSWQRQDPGFPDAVFRGQVHPVPGLEIKSWFPLATEITARFKDSQTRFTDRNTNLVLLAWLPEAIVYGRPKIVSVTMIEGGSVAQARDRHYHNPPDYLVVEPGDTSARTRNLQQTNTSGCKWEGTLLSEFQEAEQFVQSWGNDATRYRSDSDYQSLVRQLLSRYSYRLDTNFAKIDRIAHPDVEQFMRQVYDVTVLGMTIGQWARVLSQQNDRIRKEVFSRVLAITDDDADRLVK